MSEPQSEKLDPARVPSRLRTSPRWCATRLVERDGKITKPPFSVISGDKFDGWEADPKLLVTFEKALAALPQFDYLGYVLTGSQLVVSDLDHCFQADGTLKPWAVEYITLVRDLTFHAEKSPSGDGLHLWHVRADEPITFTDKKKVQRDFPDGKVELFWNNYVTVTGEPWGEFDPDNRLAKGDLARVAEWIAEKPQPVSTPAPVNEAARKYEHLLRGDYQAAGFDDESKADESLCGRLQRLGHTRIEAELIWTRAMPREKLQRRDYINRTLDRVYAGKSEPEIIDPTAWRKDCYTKDTLPKKHSEWLLDSLVAKNALTFLVAPAYNCKSWVALMIADAIYRGTPLWGFPAPTQFPILYNVPEMDSGRVYEYMDKLGIEDSPDFLVRPMELGLWSLADVRMLEAAKDGFVIFLDTKGYFDPSDDTSSYAKSLDFARLVFALLKAGSPGVVGLMHPPKYASKDEDSENRWSLENSILGSAGYGGILRSCIRLKNLNPDLNDPNTWVYAQGMKNPGLKPFQLRGPAPLVMDGEYGSSPYLWDVMKELKGGDPRKIKAFQLFVQGKTNDQIRKELGVKQNTVSQWRREWKAEPNTTQQELPIEDQPTSDDAPPF